MSKAKIIAVMIVAVLAIAGYVGFSMYRNRIIWNTEGRVGNSSGNLLNGGLFCEGGGRIYFTNTNDDGNLYSMDMTCGDFKKVYDDRAEEINYAGSYLVYSRKNYQKDVVNGEMFVFNTKGLYRLQLNTKKAKCFYDGALGIVSLCGNDIFYQHYTDNNGINLYGIKLDGSENGQKAEGSVNPSAISNRKIYYASDSESGIFSWDIATGTKTGINGANYYGCLLAGNSIYALDLFDGYKIVRMDLNGENAEVVVDEMCSVFNASEDGDYIYYQVDDGENARLECKNLDNGNVTVIIEGNYDRIHLVGQYLFFAAVNSDKFLMTSVNNLNDIQAFAPPQLK